MAQARYVAALGKALAGTSHPRVLMGGGDLAGNAGPFYSPASFRAIMLPAIKHVTDELTPLGLHIVFRTDGDLWPLTDMIFLDAAWPGYGEVDRLCGMTVGALRQRYPELVLWGNMASSHLKEMAAEEVAAESRRCVAESGGTGYFHGGSNAILMGTPVANVRAMFSM